MNAIQDNFVHLVHPSKNVGVALAAICMQEVPIWGLAFVKITALPRNEEATPEPA
jgi:hypothetical protein